MGKRNIAGAIIIIEDITERVAEKLCAGENKSVNAAGKYTGYYRFNRELNVSLLIMLLKTIWPAESAFIGKRLKKWPSGRNCFTFEENLKAFTKGEVVTINLELVKHQQFHYFSVKLVPEFDAEE